jgi:hypothetical protein
LCCATDKSNRRKGDRKNTKVEIEFAVMFKSGNPKGLIEKAKLFSLRRDLKEVMGKKAKSPEVRACLSFLKYIMASSRGEVKSGIEGKEYKAKTQGWQHR